MSDLPVPCLTIAEPVYVADSDKVIDSRSSVDETGNESLPLMHSDVYIDQLSPPVGTSFFSKHDFTISYDNIIVWKVTVHVYITGADPRKLYFAANGGHVHFILVHSGYIVVKDMARATVQLDATLVSDPSEMQLPSTGSGEAVGTEYTQHSVQFQRTMPMFRNDGNEPFSFDARFEQVFNRFRCTQTGEVGARYARLGLYSDDARDSPD